MYCFHFDILESDRSVVKLEIGPDPDRIEIAWKSGARREILAATSSLEFTGKA